MTECYVTWMGYQLESDKPLHKMGGEKGSFLRYVLCSLQKTLPELKNKVTNQDTLLLGSVYTAMHHF